MKKAITILAILAIVVSAVFADPVPASETHTISVKTVVGEVTPSFQLKYTGADIRTNTAANNNSIDDQLYYGQFGSAPTYEAASVVNLNQDISVADVTASFRAVLAIGGKQNNKSYTLAFTAGAFDTEHNGDDEPTACSQTSLNNIVGTSKENVVISNATTGNELDDGNTQTCTITMKGTAAEEKIDLVEFTAKWPRKADADVGEYTADVTLVITAGV